MNESSLRFIFIISTIALILFSMDISVNQEIVRNLQKEA